MTTAHPVAQGRPRRSAALDPTSSTPPAAAVIVPLSTGLVTHEWAQDFPLQFDAPQRARLRVRTRLTMFAWRGNIEYAAEVTSLLMANAVVHADPGPAHPRRVLSLRLALTESHELVIDVSDPVPAFPDFGRAATGELGRGLWRLQRIGARLSWYLTQDGGKTVRAILTQGPVPA